MNKIYNNPIFSSVMAFTLGSYIFSSLSFIIPHWYATWPGALSSFQNIGLWEVCFYSLMQDDIYDKIYTDCFYIDYTAISDLKNWIVTNWFIASQILFTLNFVCLMAATFIFVAMAVGTISLRRNKYAVMLAVLHATSWLTCFITLILFGVGTRNLTEDQWMPNPDQCHLSWSYGAAALSLAGNMISLVQLAFVIKTSRNGIVFWSCSKSFLDGSGEDTLPIDTRHTLGGPGHSVYDPRGDSSSRFSSNKDHSVLSATPYVAVPNKYKAPSNKGGSHLSDESKIPLSVMSRAGNSQATSVTPKQYVASEKIPVQETHINQETGVKVDKPRHVTMNAPKTFSPPASQLTVSNMSGTTSVIAAKPMKKK